MCCYVTRGAVTAEGGCGHLLKSRSELGITSRTYSRHQAAAAWWLVMSYQHIYDVTVTHLKKISAYLVYWFHCFTGFIDCYCTHEREHNNNKKVIKLGHEFRIPNVPKLPGSSCCSVLKKSQRIMIRCWVQRRIYLSVAPSSGTTRSCRKNKRRTTYWHDLLQVVQGCICHAYEGILVTRYSRWSQEFPVRKNMSAEPITHAKTTSVYFMITVLMQ